MSSDPGETTTPDDTLVSEVAVEGAESLLAGRTIKAGEVVGVDADSLLDDRTIQAGDLKTSTPVLERAAPMRLPGSKSRVYFLLRCLGHRSVEFRRGQVIKVGRHSDNDLVLNDGTVSRFHAEFHWDKDEDRPYVIDLGSANGVEVDGEPVDGRCSLPGDNQVDVGDFTVIMQLKGGTRSFRGNEAALIQSETLQTNRSVVRLFSEKGKELSGSFENTEELHALLLDLEQNERTGTLEVRSGKQSWRTTFSQGLIVTCYQGDEHGRALLAAMSESVRGSYKFTKDIEPSEECLNLAPSTFFGES